MPQHPARHHAPAHEPLPKLAAELTRLKLDVIVSEAGLAAGAARIRRDRSSVGKSAHHARPPAPDARFPATRADLREVGVHRGRAIVQSDRSMPMS